MSVITRETLYKCDKCNSEDIKPEKAKHKITCGHFGQGTDIYEIYCSVELSYVIPYKSGKNHLCRACAIDILEQTIEKLKVP